MTKKHLMHFFILTFAISWGIPGLGLMLSIWVPGFPFSLEMYTPFYFIGVWGPAIAAFIIIGRRYGFSAIEAYALRMFDWRLGKPWWFFSLIGIPMMYFFGALIEYGLGTPEAIAWYEGSWLVLIGAFLLRATAGPLEEFGWRGFALPIMQRGVSPWSVIIVLGLIHSLWHAPMFVVGQFAHFGTSLPFHRALGRFTLNILIVTVFMNIAYNATGGKLTSAFLIHWMLNGIYPWEGEADRMTGQVIATGLVAVVMLLTIARKWLSPEHAATGVIPDVADRGGMNIRTRQRHSP